jgi:hypothetical protein
VHGLVSPLALPYPSDPRLALAHRWVTGTLGHRAFTLAPASADASFRRYFRVTTDGGSMILMDAPPDKEDSRPFVAIAARLRSAGVSAPEVLAADLARGFLLLTDLGRTPYLEALAPATRERLYDDALGALLVMQTRLRADDLPEYGEGMLRFELGLFREWYLGRHLGLELQPAQARALADVEDRLVASALAQPRCFVHRDYHSRNLMVLDAGNPGVIDFQGAVHGPVTYDLVSLLRDCYVAWPQSYVRETALGYRARLAETGSLADVPEDRFLAWLDLMGVQRHLKAAGIFARLHHRDGKRHYLADIPRTLNYVREVAVRHPELAPLGKLLSALPVTPQAIPSGTGGARRDAP